MNIESLRVKFEKMCLNNLWNTARVVDMGLDYYVDDFVNGAWWMFQELNKGDE